MTLMTQAEFAKRRGVGKSAVSNWKKAGLIVFAEGADGKVFVDAERSEARLNARIDPMRGRPAQAVPAEAELPIAEPVAPAGGHNVHSARAELTVEQLIGQRQKNAVAAGELVPLVEMERRAAELGRLVRERVGAELRNAAERLAATSDVRGVMAILDEAQSKAFTALAQAVEGGVLDEDEAEEQAVPEEQIAEAA
jgi:hypothetical protein